MDTIGFQQFAGKPSAVASWRTADQIGPATLVAEPNGQDRLYPFPVLLGDIGEETRPALASDTPDAHVEHPNAQPEDDRAEISHSDDFGSVTCHGREYTFTRNQAAIVKLRREQGDAELGQDYILEEIDWTASRLRDVFKQKDGMHPAWGTWIVSGQTKGTFCLRPRQKA